MQLFYLLWTVLVYLMAVGALWWISTSLMHDNLRSQAIARVEKLTELGTPLYISQNIEQFENIKGQISNFPEIGYVSYYTADGTNRLAEYKTQSLKDITLPKLSSEEIKNLKIINNPKKSFIVHHDAKNSLVRVSAPAWVESIQSDGLLNFNLDAKNSKSSNIIGFIDLGLDYRPQQLRLAQNIKVGSIYIAILLILFMLLGRIIIKKSFAPLSRLQEPLMRLAKGEEDVHVNVEGDVEIKAICNALNRTIAAVKDRDKKLSILANNDALTGLANRYNFTQALENEIKYVSENSCTSALLFIDLDKFKYINDVLGHAAGDQLLKDIANLLTEHTRDTDYVARYGGDEFTIIAKNASSNDARNIAKALIKNIHEYIFIVDGQSYLISFSIGITMIESSNFSPDQIIAQADESCLEAKKEGRNCYRISDASDIVKEQKITDFSWTHKLRQAINNNKFIIYYQPIINLKTGSPDFHEVLLRLPDEGRKVIAPEAFLPTADRIGLSLEIDHWVINNALAEISRMQESNNMISISINLSAHTLEDDEIVNFVKKQIKYYKLLPSSIIFEIREQTAIRNINKVGKCISNLHKLGCRVALDCFGSGFDSFNYIKDWPVDFLKVDGSFIEKVSKSQLDKVIVEFMVRIAGTIGKQTVATHIENDATFKELINMGIDYGQGFHIGKPARLITDKKFKMPKSSVKPGIRSVK